MIRTTLSPPAPAAAVPVAGFAADVRHFLTEQPRQLPSRYLYDAVGSALFEVICVLPWYPLTRAEMRLLDR
ncbi:MAG TPA: L-histidine N(alpha)-methyltransferase, partial [Dongiaceae bacterium]|nr:L-histidine N(alpha)-methyltransferase [Dongiaceae bacterium]